MLDRPNIFTIDRRRIDETTTELGLYGELDLGVAPDLHEALNSAPGNVVVDLGRCEFIDSTGIALLVQSHRKLAARGDRLILFGCSGQVERVFVVTGLTDNGLVASNREEALRVLRSASA